MGLHSTLKLLERNTMPKKKEKRTNVSDRLLFWTVLSNFSYALIN